MPTLLDELLILTKVDLTGLGTGLREAEEQVKRTQSRLGELGRIPFSVDTTKATTSLKEFTAQLKEAETIQERIGRQFAGSPLPATTSNIAQHQRALNAELKESEAIQSRINRQFSSAPLPVASSNIAQHRQELELLRKEGESIQRSWGSQFGGGAMTMLPEGRRFGAASGPLAFNPFDPFAQQFAGRPTGIGGSSMSEAEFRASLLTPSGPRQFTPVSAASQEGGGVSEMLGSALAMGAAFAAVYGAMGLIKSSFTETVGLGIQFNSELEVSKIALGSLIGLSNQYKSESGATASVLTTYKASLSEAAAVQEKLFDLDAKTLGTGQELLSVYEKVRAFSRGQNADEQARLQLSSGILNAAKIFGLTNEQVATEARQILTLEHSQGQTILQNLGISMQQARSWKEQGILVQELNKALEVYNLLGTEAGNSWQGLATTFQSLKDRITGTTFAETFGAAKEVLAAMNDEFRAMRANGDILPAIFGGSEAQLRTFGAQLAHVLADTTTWVARMGNAALEFAARYSQFLTDTKNFLTQGGSTGNTLGTAEGVGISPLGGINEVIRKFLVNPLLPYNKGGTGPYADFPSSGAPFSYSAPNGDMFFNKPEQSSSSDIQARLRIGEQQLSSLSATDTRGMNKEQLNDYVNSVTKAADALSPLKIALDRVKGSLAYDVWDTNRKHVDALQNSLYGLKDTLKSSVIPPPTPEKDAVANRRNAALVAAERAESAVQKTSSGFTGDTDAYMKAQEETIKANQAKKIAAAKGDGIQIAYINREAAALTEKAWQDASKLFIEFESRKEKAAERTANVAIRTTELEAKGETQLLDIKISGVQRELQFAELRKEPISRILDLYAQETRLIREKSAIEIDAANKEMKFAKDRIDAEDKIIADYDQQIARLKAMPQTDAVKGDIDAESAKQQEAQDRKATAESQYQDLWNKGVQAREKGLNAEYTLEQRRRQADPTFAQALQDRLAQDQTGNNREFADIAVDGIHKVGSAMIQMLEGSKAGWRSLGQAAIDIVHRIEDALLNKAINEGVKAIWRKLFPPEEKPQPGPAPGGGKSPLAEVGGLASLWYGANGQDPLARGLGSLFAGGGLGGLMSWFGAGSMPGLSLAAPEAFDASAVAWTMLHSGGIVGHHMGVLSPDEHYAKLQSGEMVLSRGDTSNLFSGGSARVPGGYRPDSRIFMANVARGSGGGTGAVGGGGHQFVTINVHAKDANSFIDSAGEVQRQAATAMHRAHRRSN